MNNNSAQPLGAIIAPAWTYHSLPATANSRPKGRTLRLLSAQEVFDEQIRELLNRLVCGSVNHIERFDWFTRAFLNDSPDLSVNYRQLMREIAGAKTQAKIDPQALHSCNVCLNAIFSDHGWKQVRRRISQIERDRKSTRPIISKYQHDRLTEFKEAIGANSVDAAIDELLSFYKDEHPSFGVERETIGEIDNNDSND